MPNNNENPLKDNKDNLEILDIDDLIKNPSKYDKTAVESVIKKIIKKVAEVVDSIEKEKLLYIKTVLENISADKLKAQRDKINKL